MRARRGITNGYRWRVIRNGSAFRFQAMVPAGQSCAVVGKDYPSPEDAVREGKKWALAQPTATAESTRGCKFPPIVMGRRTR